jgi:hypothetical protein
VEPFGERHRDGECLDQIRNRVGHAIGCAPVIALDRDEPGREAPDDPPQGVR